MQAFRDFPEMAFSLVDELSDPDPERSRPSRVETLGEMIDPATAAQLYGLAFKTDIRKTLAGITVPTLVLHRAGNQAIPQSIHRIGPALLVQARRSLSVHYARLLRALRRTHQDLSQAACHAPTIG